MSQNRLTSPGERERTILPSFARYLIKALAGAAGVWLLTRWFDGYPPWATILSVLVLSIPIALAAFYHTVVGRIHRATLYRKGGWIHRWISGRGLRFLFWTLWAVGTSFFMLIQLHAFGSLEWGVFLLTIPIFWGTYHWSGARLAGEATAYWRP